MEDGSQLEGVEEEIVDAGVEETTDEAIETPAAPEVAETQAPVEYELPDGKKVDANTLAKEWKENFMPTFTRNAQELAAIKAKVQPQETAKPTGPAPWSNPEWAPENYQQLAEGLQQQVWQQILDAAQAEERQKAERDAYVQREIEEVKALDPRADVNRVMAHAAKYAFPSLIPAYQNMKAIEDAERRVEERVMRNMQSRAQEPVGTSKVTSGGTPSFPPGVVTPMDKARWVLRNQK